MKLENTVAGLLILLSLSLLSGAVEPNITDCFPYSDNVLRYSDNNIFSTILETDYPLDSYWITLNGTEKYITIAFNGTSTLIWNATLLGNVSLICFANDTFGQETNLTDGWINVYTTTSSTSTSTTLYTTTTVLLYGNLTLILVNDSFAYNICYDNLNDCYNRSDAKVIDKDYMLYLIPERGDIMNKDWLVYVLAIGLFLSVSIYLLLVISVPIVVIMRVLFKK